MRVCAINVSQWESNKAVSKTFSTELQFVANSLISWFNNKIKSKFLELDIHQKVEYEYFHPVDCENGKSCICNFSLDINPKGI